MDLTTELSSLRAQSADPGPGWEAGQEAGQEMCDPLDHLSLQVSMTGRGSQDPTPTLALPMCFLESFRQADHLNHPATSNSLSQIGSHTGAQEEGKKHQPDDVSMEKEESQDQESSESEEGSLDLTEQMEEEATTTQATDSFDTAAEVSDERRANEAGRRGRGRCSTSLAERARQLSLERLARLGSPGLRESLSRLGR